MLQLKGCLFDSAPGTSLCEVYMLFMCLRGFSLGRFPVFSHVSFKNMRVRSIGDFKLFVSVNVSVNSCVSLCGPAMSW